MFIVVQEGFDHVQHSRRHLVHFIKYEDVVFTLSHVATDPVSQLDLEIKLDFLVSVSDVS